MFRAFEPTDRSCTRLVPPISIILHCAFLAWLIHGPKPIFVAPSAVARGQGGRRVTRVYWGQPHDFGPGAPELAAPVSLQHRNALARMEWAQPPRSGKGRSAPPAETAQNADAQENTTGVSAGSPDASHAEGPLAGADVRPALPIRGSDPQVYPWELREEGDVIIEITIDEAGNITDKKVLHSMTPSIDQKVLLALESWHFHPATRDGIPISSKQDVHYHFRPS
ncbi:MAG TPA: energy transducer TonB [Terriglobales bacterium]|nr:energy transducer TonB [Terriglobales bacterium]